MRDKTTVTGCAVIVYFYRFMWVLNNNNNNNCRFYQQSDEYKMPLIVYPILNVHCHYLKCLKLPLILCRLDCFVLSCPYSVCVISRTSLFNTRHSVVQVFLFRLFSHDESQGSWWISLLICSNRQCGSFENNCDKHLWKQPKR